MGMSEVGGVEPTIDPGRTIRSKLPASLFITERLDHGERFQAWRESIGVILDVRPDATKSPPLFQSRIESYLFEDIVLSRCASGGQAFGRSSVKVASDSIDHYMIHMFIRGRADMAWRGSTLRTGRAGLIAFDLAEVMDSSNTDFDLLSVIIPRRRLAPLLSRPGAVHAALIDPGGGPGRLLGNHLWTLFSVAPTLNPDAAGTAAQSVLDLAAMAINGATLKDDDLPDAACRPTLLRVQAWVRDHLHLHDLSPDLVADQTGVSRAQLYRLFAPIGGVSDYVREQRLRRCLADLLSARHAHRQVAEIAYGWGFSDPSHFSRLFRMRFGRSPTDVRQSAYRPESRQTDGLVGDRIFEDWLTGIS